MKLDNIPVIPAQAGISCSAVSGIAHAYAHFRHAREGGYPREDIISTLCGLSVEGEF